MIVEYWTCPLCIKDFKNLELFKTHICHRTPFQYGFEYADAISDLLDNIITLTDGNPSTENYHKRNIRLLEMIDLISLFIKHNNNQMSIDLGWES